MLINRNWNYKESADFERNVHPLVDSVDMRAYPIYHNGTIISWVVKSVFE